MKFLEDRIKKDGVVKPGNVLKVDSFLNHLIDVELMDMLGSEKNHKDSYNRSFWYWNCLSYSPLFSSPGSFCEKDSDCSSG